ncbi:MAG: hypothetical protein LV471_06850 [Nitrosomonas sp.]|nr:hypothetical protein [Nitrosomonas sp.]
MHNHAGQFGLQRAVINLRAIEKRYRQPDALAINSTELFIPNLAGFSRASREVSGDPCQSESNYS